MKQAMDAFSLSVIMPALNEEQNIEAAVLLIKDTLASCPRVSTFEIIIVDDGSTDGTGRIADALSGRFPGTVTVLHNEKNRSLGYCYKRGLGVARCEYVGWLAADGSYVKEELLHYLNAFEKGTVPISYSYGLQAIKTRTLFRRVVSRAYRIFISCVFGIRGIEYVNGFAIYDRAFLRSIPIHSNGFGLMAELVLRARRAGYELRNVKMNSVERTQGKSKIFKWKNIKDLVRSTWLLFWEFHAAARGSRRCCPSAKQ